MRRGLFPGQEAALREQLERSHQDARRKMTRRAVFGAALSFGVGAVTGVFANSTHQLADAPTDAGERVATPIDVPGWVHETATGELGVLLQRQGRFLVELNQADRLDETLWLGATRLMNALVEGDERVKPTSVHLILRLRAKSPPPLQQAWLDWVEARRR